MGTMDDLFDGSEAHLLPTDDSKKLEAWNEIMKIARENALVAAAYDGVATLALPSSKKEHGWFARCQYNHMRGPHPKSIDSGESKTPNAKVSGAGTASAGLPG